MRVYYSRRLLRILEGTEDSLHVSGRLGQEINADVESMLKELPTSEVANKFNAFETTLDETIDFASEPIIYMPDEFAFFFDIESLGRLAREALIDGLPEHVAVWETTRVPVAELWIGGQGDVLSKEERVVLKRAMREVQTLPVRGKVFVVDEASYRSEARRGGSRDAIREAEGIVHERVSPACDYFVTDRPEATDMALKGGAKQILDTLTVQVMLSK